MPKWAKCLECGGEVWFDAWADLDDNVVHSFDNNKCCKCDGKDVAYETVHGVPPDEDETESSADALCRAAAHDLKRALEDVLAVMRECDEEGVDPAAYDAAIKTANDAIAKAEGRQRDPAPPHVLAALKSLLAELDDGFNADPSQETLAACRAAVAKAEGTSRDS